MARTVVVLLNYNNATDTRCCLDSLLVLSEQVRIVLVDNASPDPGIDEVAAMAPGVTLLKSSTNMGFGRGNNLGIRWALANTDCEFVLVLNNDTMVDPDAIRTLEMAMDQNPGVGIVAPRILMMETPDSLWYGGGYIHWPKGSARVPGYRGPAESPIAMHERAVTFASGCAMLVRRTVLQAIGGFDPRYFMYEEDVELCLRTCAAGWEIRYIPRAVIWHRGQGSNRKGKEKFLAIQDPRNPRLAFFSYHITKNKLLNMATHAKGINAFKFWLAYPVYLATTCARLTLHRRWDAIAATVRGIRDFNRERTSPFFNELT